ncbi:BSD domain-containing protein 1 [Anabrus simplex]|uniref:BSD domain-containing protein 1 n=1 Tax=Anabrus simplex TaxID=316456 RepID=UPI0035A361BD
MWVHNFKKRNGIVSQRKSFVPTKKQTNKEIESMAAAEIFLEEVKSVIESYGPGNSVEVLEFVKRDLDEFSSAVKSEATSVVSSTTTVLKDKLKLDEPESTANTMKRSLSSFLGQMSSALNPIPQDDDEEAIVIFDSKPVPLTKFQKKLHALTVDPNTFLTDPDEASKPQYQAWLEIVEDQLTPERLSKLMAASPELHCQYNKLVPEQVSHALFWQRYLFAKALLEDEEARLEALERRAEREKQAAENLCWEKEDFATNIELSEEEQIRLLQEYEKECEDKKLHRNGNKDDSLLVQNFKDNHYSASSSGISEVAQVDTKLEEFSDPSNTTSHVKTGKESESRDGVAVKYDLDLLKTKERKDLVIVSADGISCHTSSCSGDKESNDEDWEREFDLDEPEADLTEPHAAAAAASVRA